MRTTVEILRVINMSIPSGGAGNAPIKYTTEDELRIDTVWALKAVLEVTKSKESKK